MSLVLPLIGAGLGLVGGLVGRAASSGDRKRANQSAQQAYSTYNGMTPPKLSPIGFNNVSAPRVSAPSAKGVYAKAYTATPYLAKAYDATAAQGQAFLSPYSRLVQEGIITPGPAVDPMMIMSRDVNAPQLAAPNRLGTAFDMIRENPELKLAQMEALGMFREMSKEGLTAEDLAAMHEIFSREQQEFKAQRQGIEGAMARRGTLGSGMELAAKLQGAQDQSVIAHDQATDVAAANHAAKREGLTQYANLAGQIREQDYGMQRDKALATDDMSRYNEDNLQRVNLSNADFQLRASLANADNQLRASMANQDTRLQADIFNSDTITRTNMANVDNNLRAQMANQGMETDVNLNNSRLQTDVSMGNAQMRTDVSKFNAGNRTDVSKFNAGTKTDVSKFNAAQRTNVSMHNSDIGTRVNLQNAEMSLRARLANADAKLRASTFNSSGQFEAAKANRDAVTWEWAQTVGLADRRAAASLGQSNFYAQKAADTGQFWTNLGAGVGGALGMLKG